MVSAKRMRTRPSSVGVARRPRARWRWRAGPSVDHERDAEDGLQVGLVPAREGPPAVGGLHLGGGDDALGAVVVGEGRAVEAAELVVEDAAEARGGACTRPGSMASAEAERGGARCASSSVDGGEPPCRRPARPSPASISSSMALQTSSSTGSWTSRATATVPVKVARGEIGLEHEVVARRAWRCGGGDSGSSSSRRASVPAAPEPPAALRAGRACSRSVGAPCTIWTSSASATPSST